MTGARREVLEFARKATSFGLPLMETGLPRALYPDEPAPERVYYYVPEGSQGSSNGDLVLTGLGATDGSMVGGFVRLARRARYACATPRVT